MDKNRQIKFAKRKHLKQLKRNVKKKILARLRSQYKVELRAFRKDQKVAKDEPATGSDLIDLM